VTEQRSRPAATLAVLAVSGLAYAVMAASVNPALPTIQHDLHATETGVTFLITSYLLSAAVSTGIIGRLGDMFGKQRLLVWTLVVLAGGTLLAGLSHSIGLLIVARVIQGVGGGIFPLSFGIIRDEFPRERVAGSIGLMSSIISIGGALGVVTGGLIVEHLGWQTLFWVPLGVTVVAALTAWRLIPESPVRTPGRVNWLAAGLMSVGISTMLIGISKATDWGWGSPKTLGLIVLGLVVCAVWVLVETRSEEPLIDMAMMRRRGVWTVNLVGFLLGAGMYSIFFIFPQFTQQPTSTGYGFGASVLQSGLLLLPMTAGVMSTGPLAGPISRRWGSKAATVWGSAISAGGLVVIAVFHESVWQVVVGLAIFGVGIGLSFAALGNLIVEAVDPHETGAAGGMNTVMRMIGGAVGGQIAATFIAGHIAADGHPQLTGFVEAFAMSAIFLVVCTGASFLIPRRRPFASRLLDADAAPEGAR
jgi:EmrB/QacA subfamily drug resistance transporter